VKKVEPLSQVVVAARTRDAGGLVGDAVALLGYGVRTAACAEELVRLSRSVPCPGIVMDTSIPRLPGGKPSVLTTMRFLDGLSRRRRGCRPVVVMMIDERSERGDTAAKMRWAGWVGSRGVVDFMVRPTPDASWAANPERVLRLASYLPIQRPPINVLLKPLAIAWPAIDSATAAGIRKVDVLYEDAWDFFEQALATQDDVLRKAYIDAYRDCQAEAVAIARRLARSLWESRREAC
jgi:hypothetical protein